MSLLFKSLVEVAIRLEAIGSRWEGIAIRILLHVFSLYSLNLFSLRF